MISGWQCTRRALTLHQELGVSACSAPCPGRSTLSGESAKFDAHFLPNASRARKGKRERLGEERERKKKLDLLNSLAQYLSKLSRVSFVIDLKM